MFGRTGLPPADAIRAAAVVALEGGDTYEIARAGVDELRARYPSVDDALLALAGQDVYWVAQRYLDVLFVDAESRVRRRLLELGRQYGDGNPDGRASILVTQDDLAGLAGVSRATVNRVLGEEQRHGALERRRGRIVLLDPDELAKRVR